MNKKILIVEDEMEIAKLFCEIFEGLENYETIYAVDGRQALIYARANKPDLLLLDIQLPDLTGYEVCRLIKVDPALSNTKILMISGLAPDSDWLKALEIGVDDCIAKPFCSSLLIEKIDGLLRSNQER